MPVPIGNHQSSVEHLTEAEALAGITIYRLFLDPAAWTHRRVESIGIVDDESIHRRVSLDLTIDPDLPGIRWLGFTPLTLLKKEVLHNFDLRNHEGHPVPVLTKSQNGRIAGNALVVLAEEILDAPIPVDVGKRLRAAAIANPGAARIEFSSWPNLAVNHANPHREIWEVLLGRKAFVDLSEALVENFTLLAACDPTPGRRRLVKLAYEERFEKDGDRLRRPFVRLGWARCTVEIDVPAVSFSESYHLEIEAPTDLEIDAAQLRLHRDAGASPDPQSPTTGGGLRRAHLYISEVGSEFRGQALVFLRRRRDAFLWSAFLTALLVSVLLGLGRWRLDELLSKEASERGQTAAALLLITPTLLAAYIAQTGEHRLASRVLLGVRALVVGTGVCAVVAAGVLAAGFSLCDSRAIWGADLVLSVLIAAGLFLSLLLPRPTRP